MEFDIEVLVSMVQAKPFLYDTSLPAYKDLALCRRTWENITKQFTADWDQLSPRQKREEVKHMRNKWRSLRDTYKRHLNKLRKRERSGSGAVPKPTYKHWDLLSFLRPCYQPRRTEDSFMEEEDQDEDSQSSVTSPPANSEVGDEVSEVPSTEPSSSANSAAASRRRRASTVRKQSRVTEDHQDREDMAHMSKTYNDILDYMKTNRERQRASEERVPYKMVTSLIPYLDDVDPSFYGEVHIELIQVALKYQAKTKQKRENERQGNYPETSTGHNTMGLGMFGTQQPWRQPCEPYPPLPPSQVNCMGRIPGNSRSMGDVVQSCHGQRGTQGESRTYQLLERTQDGGTHTADMSMTRLLFDYDTPHQ